MIDTARALLPAWVGWVTLLWIPALTFVVCAPLTYLSARVAVFREDGIFSCEWTERSRAMYPARRAMQLTLGVCLGILIVFLTDHQNPLIQTSFVAMMALCLPGMILASVCAQRAIARRLGDPVRSWREYFRNLLTSWVRSPGLLILGIVLLAMPTEFNARVIVVSLIGFATFGFCLFGTLGLLFQIGLVSRASGRLEAAVSQASGKIGVAPSSVYEIDSPRANAWALMLTNELVFTRRTVEMLDDEELTSVACHELAHLAEPAKVRRLYLAQLFVPFAIVWINLLHVNFGRAGIYGLLLFVSGTSMCLRRWRRGLENRADAVATSNQTETGVYARAPGEALLLQQYAGRASPPRDTRQPVRPDNRGRCHARV